MTMTTPRSVEFNEMVARFYLSVEVLIGEFDQTVVGYRKLGIENEFLEMRRLEFSQVLLLCDFESDIFLKVIISRILLTYLIRIL